MNIIFNRKLLEHNKDEIKADGSYRLQGFLDKYPDTELDFDPMPFIEKIHTKEYINKFKKECQTNGYMAEVNLTPESYDCALLSVGLAIKASQTGDFAIIRPPGHHARSSYGSGFCFLNVDAIVVKKLLEEGKRVALLDIDGHRGDGTQEILKDENEALLVSIHQKNVYGGDGEKFSDTNAINFPLEPPVTEEIYLETLEEAIKYIKEFEPDIVGISAGFDTYKEDKLLKFDLDIESYFKIGKLISSNFDNTFAFLSGGYHDKILVCVESFVSGINSVEN